MNDELKEYNLMNELYDLYGELLTPKQKDVFEKYYFFNLSLQEIAEELNISKNAVLDNLEHSKHNLLHFEEILRFNQKITTINALDVDETVKNKIIEELKR